MLDVFLTVDVEVWCDDWNDLDTKFPNAFKQYIYGPTSRGNYGLPYQLCKLQEHGLTGIFFVEPLFSTRFGLNSLTEILSLIREKDHEIQLHLHTEWIDESIELAGGKSVNAFRAGNFGFNSETLRALSTNHIAFDSSYNASIYGPDSGISPGTLLVEPFKCEEVYEYPMTVFQDGTRSLRHAQITACSYQEMEGLLWQALELKRNAFVILFHGSELLNRAKDRPDDIVVDRFNKLCLFLDRHRDCFRVRGFHGLTPPPIFSQSNPLTSPIWKTGLRMLEQGMRRKFR
jgi:hypothetical protein